MTSRFVVVHQQSRRARIHIGIPTYNGSRRTEWLIRSLERAGGLPSSDVAITVLDDGSPRAHELPALHALSTRYGLNLLSHPTNRSLTQSWNDIANFVDCEFVVLLNDDVMLTPRWLDHLVYFLENNECGDAAPNLFCFTEADVPRLLAGQDPEQIVRQIGGSSAYYGDPEDFPRVVIAAPGSCFGFKRQNYLLVGGFDERLHNSHTEIWFGTALAERGLPSFVLVDRIWHLGSATLKNNPELGSHIAADHQTFITKWGEDIARYLVGIPPRVVRWLDLNGNPREKEMTICVPPA